MKNNQLLLVSRPMGTPKEANFAVQSTPIKPLNDGEVLVKNQFLSIDPAMRSWMAEGKSYINPIQIGGVMRAMGVGLVLDSKYPEIKAGEYISTELGVQEYSTLYNFTSSQRLGVQSYVYSIKENNLPLPTHLGALGIPGMTAYFGMLAVGKIQAGETVVISGAAGGVGTIAGQIAKIKGCKVIGITSSDEKCQGLLHDFNFDYAINYKNPQWKDELMGICPEGVQLFFDNVGGDILNTLLGCLSKGGRVILSGAASQYNNMAFMRGPANYLSLIVNRAKIEGFVNIDYYHQFDEARNEIKNWIQAGLLNPDNYVVKGGIDDFHAILIDLFAGKNLGKMVMELQTLN
ncbi:MAG: NADP-dependent oxidoreductase [Arcicella sp.]|jgi:NADPH-dependent curcumin reductase|nr:NADP-dependent oxidoreductase [Arcicella sp.]